MFHRKRLGYPSHHVVLRNMAPEYHSCRSSAARVDTFHHPTTSSDIPHPPRNPTLPDPLYLLRAPPRPSIPPPLSSISPVSERRMESGASRNTTVGSDGYRVFESPLAEAGVRNRFTSLLRPRQAPTWVATPMPGVEDWSGNPILGPEGIFEWVLGDPTVLRIGDEIHLWVRPRCCPHVDVFDRPNVLLVQALSFGVAELS